MQAYTFGEKYEALELIKLKGGQGDLYLVQDDEGKEFMLKYYLPWGNSPIGNDISHEDKIKQTEENLKLLQRFEQEIDILQTLDHANILKLHDSNSNAVRGGVYVVLEYVDGINLYDLNKKDRIYEHEIVNMGIQIADALEYISSKNIVHRNVRPETILYDQVEKKYYLTDFEISKFHDITRTGEFIGMPQYMPPELVEYYLAKGESTVVPNYLSDMYALGVTFYRLLSRGASFDASDKAKNNSVMNRNNLIDTPLKHLKLPYPVSDSMSDICEKCMQRDPEKRYESFESLKSALYTISKE